MKTRKMKADENSEYKKLLNEIGSDSNAEDDVVDFLEKMYIGNRNNPSKREAGKPVGENLDDPLVDNPPIPAVNTDYPDEGFDSDKDEEDFFVDLKDDGENNPNLKKLKDLQMMLNYPAGNKANANSKQPNVKKADKNVEKAKAQRSKEAAREQMKLQAARIANAKNLATLIAKKGLAAREDVPSLVKMIASLDNKGFGLVKQIVEAFSGQEAQGRKAKASANTADEVMLSKPIHIAKPATRGQNLVDQFASIQWEGCPDPDYDHKKYTSQ